MGEISNQIVDFVRSLTTDSVHTITIDDTEVSGTLVEKYNNENDSFDYEYQFTVDDEVFDCIESVMDYIRHKNGR